MFSPIFIFSLFTASFAYKHNNHDVDYIATYIGDEELTNSYRFSTALDDNYLIEEQKRMENIVGKCAKNKNCLGIYKTRFAVCYQI